MSLKTHGIREVHANRDAYDFAAEEIRTVGYTVIDSGLSPADLVTLREKVDAIYEEQLRDVGGEEALVQIRDADVARCLAGYDDWFVHLAAHPALMEITRRLLGDYFILMSQNAIINRPTGTHYQQTWHRDLNYQHFVSSRPVAVSALYAMDDFSEHTGGTLVLPASHKVEAFPSVEFAAKHELTLSAKAGSILVFDAMLFHRSGRNQSGSIRRALNHIYTLPLIKQQISIPRVLGGRFREDPFLRFFLGYDTETADSVREWRELKLGVARQSQDAADAKTRA
jgi:ectoine hydroxylase-related dioxygenase (phytanoyl-CoA dioxygenase family)